MRRPSIKLILDELKFVTSPLFLDTLTVTGQEAAKAYQASVEIQSKVLTEAPLSEVPSQSQVDITVDVDHSLPHERGTKRSAEDDSPSVSHKKTKTGIILAF